MFAFALSIGFGMLFVIFPKGVVKFYTWLHEGKNTSTEKQARTAGFVWIVLMIIVLVCFYRR